MSVRMGWMAVALLAVFSFCADVQAAEVKIGMVNIQKIIAQSDRGQAARKRFEARGKELEAKFKPEQDSLIALQKDIEKNSSVWSQEVRADKVRQFQRMQHDFQAKTDDARLELKQMQDKELEPILKALQDIVGKIGKDGGYTMVVEAHSGFYFDQSIDLSDTIIKRLNTTLK